MVRVKKLNLWKKIDEKDLRDDKDNYWSVAGDLAFMWPMIEMSGLDHFKFIDEILYVYKLDFRNLIF